jgi:hypothetical protein
MTISTIRQKIMSMRKFGSLILAGRQIPWIVIRRENIVEIFSLYARSRH